MLHLIRMLAAYRNARGLRPLELSSRAALERHQQKRLSKHLSWLSRNSPYFAPYAGLCLSQWPTMNKQVMLAEFDRMNTAGLSLDSVMQTALQAEQSRDFSSRLGRYTVGLSSGTSGRRGAFVVSPQEQARWAGVMLAKALPDGLFAGERVALFLRANSNLYSSVSNRWISFRYFDLFAPLDEHLAAMQEDVPTIILAPAQVLRELAIAKLSGRIQWVPKRVYSIAEVIEVQDRALIESAFGQVHEVYQATEGFLAISCEHGVLHMNEEHLHVEVQWIDKASRRFMPVITDFGRRTQPIVRYRLDDVLRARSTPCTCGRVTLALEAVEGRCDDSLVLPDANGQTVVVFADVMSRALSRVLPLEADFRLYQTGPSDLALHADVGLDVLTRAHLNLCGALERLHVDTRELNWELSTNVATHKRGEKRRRIERKWSRQS